MDHACTFDNTCESCFTQWQTIEDVLAEFGKVKTAMAVTGEAPLRRGTLEVRVTLDDGRVLLLGEPDGPFTFMEYGHLIERPLAIAIAIYSSFDALSTSAGRAGYAEAHGCLLHDLPLGVKNLMTAVAATPA